MARRRRYSPPNIERELINLISTLGGQSRPPAIYEGLDSLFRQYLSPTSYEELDERGEPKWWKAIRNARQSLVKKGHLIGGVHGIWQLTPLGFTMAQAPTTLIHTSNESSVSGPKSYSDNWIDDDDELTEEEERLIPRYREVVERIETDFATVFLSEGELLQDLITANSIPFIEGSRMNILVERIERNAKARAACIDHYGPYCLICGFDFEEVYGSIGLGFIQVHHLDPLAKNRDEHSVDPIQDLIPVCPNCHAMIHMRTPPFDVAELRQLMAPAG
jgi:hypothetical protein